MAAPKGKSKKAIVARVRIQIKPGEANPGPPIAPSLGPHGVNIMEFCKAFNAKTESLKGSGYVVPVRIVVFSDRSFDFTVGQPTMTSLIKKVTGLKSGSVTPGKGASVAVLSLDQALEIAKIKEPDLTASHRVAILKTIVGSAKSMGISCDFIPEEQA